MNTAKLARTTFVLDRETHDRLNYVARRMGVSRSTLVRDVLAEPVEMMEKWVRQVPEEQPLSAVASEIAQKLGESMQMDLVEFIDRKSAEVVKLAKGGGDE